jgi:hypothetical protein
MHVRRVAGQQDASVAVGRGLPRRIGEPRDKGRAVDPVIGSVHGDERLAEIAQRGFGRADVLFGHHDSHGAAVRVDHLAVADLVLHPTEGMDAALVAADPQLRLLGHLDLGDQAARRRIPPRELDARCFPDDATSSVAPDEVLRPQRSAARRLHVDAVVVLRHAGHFTSAVDSHRQFGDPAGQDPLDVLLPQPEPVVVPAGKVADVQRGAGEPRDLGHLSLREEPIGDSTLIEDLDGA